MTLILGVGTPEGMSKLSISSLSPNSLSIKRSEVLMTCDAKLEYYEGRPKILISQLNFSYLCLISSHVIRIALVCTSPGAPICFDFFFPVDFR